MPDPRLATTLAGRLNRLLIPVLALWLIAAPDPAAARSLLWQTNADGDDIHIYDAGTGALVRRLVVGDNPHGIATAENSDTVFVSLERNGRDTGLLLWINKETFDIEHELEVGLEPHAIAATPDGRWVYVPCRDGHYWVIDAERRAVATKIHTGGRPHNTTASPDGRFVYLSPMGAPKRVTLVAPSDNHTVAGEIDFSESVRPPAIAASRDLFFQHVDGLNGFEVADLGRRERIARIEHSGTLGIPIPPSSAGFLGWSGLSRCHGLAVRPGDEEIWSVCGRYASVHSIASDDFPERARLRLPGKAYWLTFSPDGQYAFIALSSRSEVAMIDADRLETVRLLKAGRHPKRNLVISSKSQPAPYGAATGAEQTDPPAESAAPKPL